jgi:hypothetical protein
MLSFYHSVANPENMLACLSALDEFPNYLIL